MASLVGESRKKYTRGELFDLAKSLNDAQIDQKQLNKFRETKLIHNDIVDCADSSNDLDSLGPRPRLGRPLSKQQSFERKPANFMQQQQQQQQPRIPQRIARMTSSPALKYNKNYPNFEDRMFENDSISSQAQAKYAELIENLTGGGSGGHHSMANRRQPVTRSTSLNSWTPASEHGQRRQMMAADRPTSLFGPLRRDISSRGHQDHARDSDEPLSLPYLLTNASADSKSSGAPSKSAGEEDISHSPIRRMQSFVKVSADNEKSNDIEDDDFDLNSLLNITVLSDIKTIRQDFQCSSLQRDNSSRSKQIQPRQARDHRMNQETGMRPLTRSRTATEFNYRSRYQQQPQPQLQQPAQAELSSRTRFAHGRPNAVDDHRNETSYQLTGYDSMPASYNNWQQHHDQQQQQQQQRQGHSIAKSANQESEAPSKRDQSKPVDEKVAHIIETFKAQVKARAASSDLPAEQKSENSLPPVKINPTGEPKKEKTDNSSDSKDGAISKEEKEEEEKEPTIIVENKPEPDGAKPVSSIERELSDTKDSLARSKSSNIPRLISLHLKVQKSDDSGAKSADTKSPAGARAMAQKSVPLSSKFVSQYRQLRGKSLADEIGEQASK